MKKPGISLVLAIMLQAGVGHADTVTREVPDNLPGKGFGGLSGFMIGAAAGGPIGAVVGIGIGWLVGGETQEATGLSGTTYQVRREDGSETFVRSPNQIWSPGDRVRIVNSRLIAVDEANEAPQPVTFLYK